MLGYHSRAESESFESTCIYFSKPELHYLRFFEEKRRNAVAEELSVDNDVKVL